MWVDRIKEAVNTALSGGDIAIMARKITQDHQTLNTYYDGFGGGWRWGGGFGDSTTTVDHYKVGKLVVDLLDANTKQLVWRGSSSDTLSDKSDKNIKALDKGVDKMFDHFPPGTPKH
jgi:Domain of unknown function (DUF4136)